MSKVMAEGQSVVEGGLASAWSRRAQCLARPCRRGARLKRKRSAT